MQVPSWLRPVAVVTSLLVAGILIGAILMVPYRSMKAPGGDDQPRIHWNTKNSTRFVGGDAGAVAAMVSRAVYPATEAANRPAAIILFEPSDWQSGLLAAPLLRPLNAILMPATDAAAADIERLQPLGSPALGGAALLLLEGAQAPSGVAGGQSMSRAEVLALRAELLGPPEHAILVDPDDAATALLAAPWAAYSGDLVVLDAADVPAGVPLYSLGDNVSADGAVAISGRTPGHVAVALATYEDEENPGFGWGMNAGTTTGYRAYTLARLEDPATALLSANLAVRGKPGPLLWTEERRLPQVVNNYLWSQRAAFWVTPAEGPFHHFWVLGDSDTITFPAQGQADYAVEMGPYLGKGVGASGLDMLAAGWVVLGMASALWIVFHQGRMLRGQMWVMKLAWPLLALMLGPFGILVYYLAYRWPVMRQGSMVMWDRPLWAQGMVATASAVGVGASLMIVAGFIMTLFGIPLNPSRGTLLTTLASPMVLIMISNYIVAVVVSWLLFQTPMLSHFYQRSYVETLPKALPMVLISMTAAAIGMNPSMWWMMMKAIPMMPTEESILWFGVMFFTGFLAFLVAWPLNYVLVRVERKSGMM